MSDHDHDGGLARDLPLLTRRRIVAGIGLAGVAGVGAWLLGGAPGLAKGNLSGSAADGSVCLKDGRPIPGRRHQHQVGADRQCADAKRCGAR